MKEYKIPSLLVYFDASNSGLASVYKEKGKANIYCKNFSDQEKSHSCTWRELEAIHSIVLNIILRIRQSFFIRTAMLVV